MLLSFRHALEGGGQPEGNGWFSPVPNRHVWLAGYCFKGDRPLIKEQAAEAVCAALSGQNRGDSLEVLNGSYCAVVLSADNGRVDLISDRFGSRPLYYAKRDTDVLVSEDFWSIVDALPFPELNVSSAIEILMYDYVLGSHTLVEGVEEVPASSVLSFTSAEGSKRPVGEESFRYWEYDIRPRSAKREEMVDELGGIFVAVGKRYANLLATLGIRRLGLNLTNGLDSRVLACLFDSNHVDMHCFTSADIGKENEDAFRVSRALKLAHTFVPLWCRVGGLRSTRLFWDLIPTTMFTVSNHPVSLDAYGPWPVDGFVSGHMGDPVTGRQAGLRALGISRRGHDAVCDYMERKHVRWPASSIERVLRKDVAERVRHQKPPYREHCSGTRTSDPYTIVTRVDIEQRQRRFILRDYGALCNLGPSVLPFADYELWDYYSGVPFQWQINGRLYVEAVFKHVFAGRYAPLKDVRINLVRKGPTRFPAYKNYMKSFGDVLKAQALSRTAALFGRNVKADANSAFLANCLKKGVLAGLPYLDCVCDTGSVRRILEASNSDRSLNVERLGVLYSLMCVSARVRDKRSEPIEWE